MLQLLIASTGWQIVNTLILGFTGLALSILNHLQSKERNYRDALFKCLDRYSEVQELGAKAWDDMERGDAAYNNFMAYYRALFDLQWTEFHLWRHNALEHGTYLNWAHHRYRDFLRAKDKAITIQDSDGQAIEMSYQYAWQKLCEENYFLEKDLFVKHMNLIHQGEFKMATFDKLNFSQRVQFHLNALK